MPTLKAKDQQKLQEFADALDQSNLEQDLEFQSLVDDFKAQNPIQTEDDALQGLVDQFKTTTEAESELATGTLATLKRPEVTPAAPEATAVDRRLTQRQLQPEIGTPPEKEGLADIVPSPVKAAFNQSITGLAYQLVAGEQAFDLSGYDPSVVGEIAATVMSFLMPLDVATLAIGGAPGKLAVSAIAKTATQKLIQSGVKEAVAKRAVQMASKRIVQRTGARALPSGTALATYSGAQSALSQKNLQGYIDGVQVAQDALKGGALGLILGGTGGLTAGLGRTAQTAAEIEAFGTGEALLEARMPTLEDYAHATGIVLGLKLQHGAVRKAKKATINRVGEWLADRVVEHDISLEEALQDALEKPIEDIVGEKVKGVRAELPEVKPKEPEKPEDLEGLLKVAEADQKAEPIEPKPEITPEPKEKPTPDQKRPFEFERPEFPEPGKDINDLLATAHRYGKKLRELSGERRIGPDKVQETPFDAVATRSEVESKFGRKLTDSEWENVEDRMLKGTFGLDVEPVGGIAAEPVQPDVVKEVEKPPIKEKPEDVSRETITPEDAVKEVDGVKYDAEFPPGNYQFTTKELPGELGSRTFSISKEGFTLEGLRKRVETIDKEEQTKLAAITGEKPPEKPPVAETPKEAVGPPKPPQVETKPVETEPEPSVVRLNKEETAQLREIFERQKLPVPLRETMAEAASEAKEQGYVERSLEVADEVIANKRAMTQLEHAGSVLKATELLNQYDADIKESSRLVELGQTGASKDARERADIALENFDKLTRATDLSGTEQSRALSFRRMGIDRESMELAPVKQRMQASKRSKLTSEESQQVEQFVAEHSKWKNRFEELEKKYDDERAEREKIIAEQVTAIEIKKARIKKKAKGRREIIMVERADIKKQLQDIGFRVNDVTGVTAEGSYLIGKLAVNYIKEGVVSLDAVVQKVMADIPGITQLDVYEAMNAKSTKAIKKARNKTQKKITQLKKQAKLLVELDNASQGIFKKRKGRVATKIDLSEFKALRDKINELRAEAYKSNIESTKLDKAMRTINELQDQLANQYRNVRKGKAIPSEELQALKDKIADLRKAMRTEDTMADLNEQLRTGEFKIKARPTLKQLPLEVERAQVEMRVVRKKIRAMIADAAPLTPRKAFVETINTLRTLKATADMSGVLRQGFALVARRPVVAARMFGKAFQATFSSEKAEAIDIALRSVDHHYLREKADLFLPEVGATRLLSREEVFMSRFLEKVPGLGHVVKASERNMVTFLNLMRVSAFDQFLIKYPNATPKELQSWASWVNIASGRGDLGKAAAVANELSLVVFAPRFSVSRIQTPLMAFKNLKNPRVRNEIVKDYVAIASVGATALGLASLAGWVVGDDPRSPDFGKIRIGNTRFDLWAGMQQPMRVISRIGLGITDKAGLTGKELTERQKDIDPMDLITRFAQYKSAPAVTVPLEFYKGRTIVGEPVTPAQTALRSLLPIIYEDIWDTYKEAGMGMAAITGAAGFLGVGVNTYEDSENVTRSKIRKFLNEDNREAAFELKTAWNIKHPDNRIVSVKRTLKKK